MISRYSYCENPFGGSCCIFESYSIRNEYASTQRFAFLTTFRSYFSASKISAVFPPPGRRYSLHADADIAHPIVFRVKRAHFIKRLFLICVSSYELPSAFALLKAPSA